VLYGLYTKIGSVIQGNQKKLLEQRKLFIIMIALVVCSIIDVSLVKINDLIDKYFIPIQGRLVLFSLNGSLCLLLQFFLIKYIRGSFKGDRMNKTLKMRAIHTISLISLIILAALIGFSIFQQFYYGYYSMSINIAIITISYGTAACLLIWKSILFYSWFRSSHNLIVLLYLISISMIAFNLIITAAYVSLKLSFMARTIAEYIGSSGDLSSGKRLLIKDIYNITTFISFLSMWITAAILMNYYREKLINAIIYWVILSIPLVYFIITYFYQYILGGILTSYLQTDPVTVSIILGAFLALSKPIGGILFGIVFWKISRIVGYERRIKTFMIISGWGILFIFSSNQAVTQIVIPYPPFGLPTVTILVIASYLMLLGIYNSATLVSTNNELRKSIYKRALESKFLGLIGQAEMENEIQNTVKQVSRDKNLIEKELEEPVELDETELKKYVEFVIKEARHKDIKQNI
jgi:hypothetical protein